MHLKPSISAGILFAAGSLLPRTALADATCTADALTYEARTDILYVRGDVSCTLTDLRALADPDTPLEEVEDGVWWLGATVILEEGATLVLDGTSRGGDVDELRLESRGSSYVELRAMWGNLFIRGTKVTSWSGDGPDENVNDGRAFVRVVSYLEPDGVTARESRMDVIDSEIAYLGFYDGESYGLVWKVRGTTSGLYDQVDVFGDVTNSVIHHNYFGFYSYGAYGMNIVGNEVYGNHMYGIDPHDDSDSLYIADNYMHDNGTHGFICSMRCDGLTVRDNVSNANGGVGYMLHRGVTDSVMEGNLAEDNADAGYALFDSYHNVVRNNVSRRNKYGLRLSCGATDNLFEGNEVVDSTLYGIYFYQGSDPPSINDGHPARNTFRGNRIARSAEMGIRATDADDNVFEANVFEENGEITAFLFDSTGNVFTGDNELGGGRLEAQGRSDNVVKDSDFVKVMLGDTTASWAFTDTTGRALDNDVGLPTRVDGAGSALTLSRADSTGAITVDTLPLGVVPGRGSVTLQVLAWAPGERVWATTPGSAAGASFTVGELTPGGRYALRIDGELRRLLRADANGVVRFGTDVAKGPHTFSLTPARPGSTWSPK